MGKAHFEFGSMRQTKFDANAFWGNLTTLPEDTHAINASPQLVSPGSGGVGFASLIGYTLQSGSPCIAVGMPIDQNGGHDFWGNPIASAEHPNIGVDQKTAK